MAEADEAIRGNVTSEDIAAGTAGDCFRCPVAIALARATGDSEANVYESYGDLMVQVSGRHMMAPYDIRHFVYGFDGQPRTEDDHIDLNDERCEPPKPFSFVLPSPSDSEWEERCYACEELFAPADLDDEGVCEGCRKPEADAAIAKASPAP